MRFDLSENSADSADAASSAPSRRTMLRGAAAVAWAVPAIAVASATPAFAASGVTVPALTGLSETVEGSPAWDRTLRVSIPLTVPSGAFPQGSVITVRVYDPSTFLAGAPTPGAMPAGWQQVDTASGSKASGWLYTFRTTSGAPTLPFVVTFDKTSIDTFKSANATILITVTPVGGTSTSHPLTWSA